MWNEDGITTLLPVQPDDSISIPISLYGYNYFYADADNSEGFLFFLYLIKCFIVKSNEELFSFKSKHYLISVVHLCFIDKKH